MERLLRLKLAKYQDSPSRTAPWPRTESPSGASTLITSAPRSASSAVQNGPDSTRVRSTILIPDNGITSPPSPPGWQARRGARKVGAGNQWEASFMAPNAKRVFFVEYLSSPLYAQVI